MNTASTAYFSPGSFFFFLLYLFTVKFFVVEFISLSNCMSKPNLKSASIVNKTKNRDKKEGHAYHVVTY